MDITIEKYFGWVDDAIPIQGVKAGDWVQVTGFDSFRKNEKGKVIKVGIDEYDPTKIMLLLEFADGERAYLWRWECA